MDYDILAGNLIVARSQIIYSYLPDMPRLQALFLYQKCHLSTFDTTDQSVLKIRSCHRTQDLHEISASLSLCIKEKFRVLRFLNCYVESKVSKMKQLHLKCYRPLKSYFYFCLSMTP